MVVTVHTRASRSEKPIVPRWNLDGIILSGWMKAILFIGKPENIVVGTMNF